MAERKPRRWIRRILVAVAVVLLAPLAILAVYRFVPPPGTPLMVLRAVAGADWDYRWRSLDRMSSDLPGLAVAAEDNLFCRHRGIDVGAFREQVELAMAGERPRGASTISMQLAKNLFLWPDRSLVRKGLDFWLTPYVELMLPKRRIIELYLNIAEWGSGIYGAEAAARHHFGVSAADLSRTQASLLAAVLPNPLAWSAGRPGSYVRERAGVYRRRVTQLGPEHLGCWGETP